MSARISLTTDFGMDSPYVAMMKGVILAINPHVQIIDINHDIAPQDVTEGAFLVAEIIPYFPADTIHVVVVDPWVGTGRNILYVEVGHHQLIVPDNGIWTLLLQRFHLEKLIAVNNPKWWRSPVSATFHGRDIFAPVAAYLSRGIAANELGSPVDTWSKLPFPMPKQEQRFIQAQVIYIDHFGNLITNIQTNTIPHWQAAQVLINDVKITQAKTTYGESQSGELIFLSSSNGWLEIAKAQGNAAKHLNAQRGTPVQVKIPQNSSSIV